MSVLEINAIIQQSLLEAKFKKREIEIVGGKRISDGYQSDIIFLNVNCETEYGKEEILNIAIKQGNSVESLEIHLTLVQFSSKKSYFLTSFIRYFWNSMRKEMLQIFSILLQNIIELLPITMLRY